MWRCTGSSADAPGARRRRRARRCTRIEIGRVIASPPGGRAATTWIRAQSTTSPATRNERASRNASSSGNRTTGRALPATTAVNGADPMTGPGETGRGATGRSATGQVVIGHAVIGLAVTGPSTIGRGTPGRRGAIGRSTAAIGHSNQNGRSEINHSRATTGRAVTDHSATGHAGTDRSATGHAGIGRSTTDHAAIGRSKTGRAAIGRVEIVRPEIVRGARAQEAARTVRGNRRAKDPGSRAALVAGLAARQDHAPAVPEAPAVPNAADDLAHRPLRTQGRTIRV
jgi:ATP-dependent RNA helicase DeaD